MIPHEHYQNAEHINTCIELQQQTNSFMGVFQGNLGKPVPDETKIQRIININTKYHCQ